MAKAQYCRDKERQFAMVNLKSLFKELRETVVMMANHGALCRRSSLAIFHNQQTLGGVVDTINSVLGRLFKQSKT